MANDARLPACRSKISGVWAILLALFLTGCTDPKIEIPSDIVRDISRGSTQTDANAEALKSLREDVARVEAAIDGLNQQRASANDFAADRDTQLLDQFEQRFASLIPDDSQRLQALEDQQAGLQECLDQLTEAISKMECQCEKSTVTAVATPVTTGKVVSINGNVYDLGSYVAKYRRQHVGVIGSLDAHLREHGVSETTHLTTQEKQQLHDALHGAGVAAKNSVTVAPRSTVSVPFVQSSNCANGQCSQPRFRLFGRR